MAATVWVDTYRARRRIQMAPGLWREPGELIPEATSWVRVDAWLHGGHIVKAQVSKTEFTAAVKKYCPELTQWLTELADLDANISLHGPHNSPRRTDPSTATKDASTTYARPELILLKGDTEST